MKGKSNSPAHNKPKVPDWITTHIQQSMDAHKTLLEIIHISERGIGVLRGIPHVVKVLANVKGETSDPESVARLEKAEEMASLAKSEIAKDFPVLHGLAVVALWSWLEHFVKGFVALWLLNRKDALTVVTVQKLKVKLGDYLQLQGIERGNYIVELLEQELASPLKRGVTRFESLLEPFGLTSPLPKSCTEAIFELQQVRNAIAHKNGRADRRLKAECPWLKVRINEPIKVSREMVQRYAKAEAEYLLALLYRVGDIYGCDLRASETEGTKSVTECGPHVESADTTLSNPL